MPLDEATLRLTSLLERDLGRLVDRERTRAARGEEVRYDSVSRMATWETRRGDVIGRWYGEVVAYYLIADRMLRWAWAGRTSLETPSHAEVVSQEGQTRNVPQLSMSVVGNLDEASAWTLARLGVLVARGEGLKVRRTDTEIHFIGLFDSPCPRDHEVTPARYSVPPPPMPVPSAERPSTRPSAIHTPNAVASPRKVGSNPPPLGYRSIPPIREIFEPRATPRSRPSSPPGPAEERKIREPARALFVPVATVVLNALRNLAAGFQQALFVLHLHTEASSDLQALASPAAAPVKRRLVVTLVAVDATGVLRALDPPNDVVDAAVLMVEADRIDGNGPWRKLTARITPKPDGGATLHVDVL